MQWRVQLGINSKNVNNSKKYEMSTKLDVKYTRESVRPLGEMYNLVPRVLPLGKTLAGAGHVTLQK